MGALDGLLFLSSNSGELHLIDTATMRELFDPATQHAFPVATGISRGDVVRTTADIVELLAFHARRLSPQVMA